MISHPFVNLEAVQEKDMEQLAETISDLTGKLQFAFRLNRPDMVRQLQMAIESYRSVYTEKQQEMWNKNAGNQIGKIDIK